MIPSTHMRSEWWIYALVSVGYTVAVGYLSTDSIFSKRNVKSFSYVLWSHLVFLGIILGFTWLAIRIYPYMPDWVIHTSGRGSFFGVLFVGIGIFLALVENQGGYLDSKTHKPVRKKQTEAMPNKKTINPERH